LLPLVTVTSSLFNTGILSLIYIIDLLGTLVFAISGVMIAVKNKFDVIGALIIGLVTAVGGGTLRDVLMGIVSACFGGVIRDVLCNEVPLIFRKEIYASACLVGGLTYLLIVRLTDEVAPQMIVPILVVLAIRYYAVRRHWQLPFSPL